MKREKWIDNAKGIAMLLVILGHVSGQLTGRWNFQFVYGIHLVVFFILSGYTMKKKTLNRDFLNIKFSRLMAPYFYTCLAVMIMDLFNSWKLNHDLSIASMTRLIGNDLLRSFFASGSIKTFGAIEIGMNIGAIWFLPAMFFATLIFQYLLNKTENEKLLGLLTAIIALVGFITAKFLWLPFSIQSGMLASFFLWIGHEIKKHHLLEQIKWWHYLIAQVLLLFGIYHEYCRINFVSTNLGDLFLSVPVGLSGCLLVYLISRADEKGVVLSYIGRISLTVLCTHLFTLNTLSQHFRLFLEKTSLTGNAQVWAYIMLHIGVAILAAVVIELLKKTLYAPHQAATAGFAKKQDANRDLAIDIAKGFFIISMIVGHFSIDLMLRSIIFSCHMMAFIVFSGYFYRKGTSFSETLKRVSKTFLLPYALFVAAKILLEHSHWSISYFHGTIIRYLLGMSFSKNIFTSVASIGPVYFILLLFVIWMLYTAMDRWTRNSLQLTVAVLCVSVLGLTLGKEGWWLPWSIDIACYSMVFYHIGVLLRHYEVFKFAREWSISYFLLSPVWAFMIYCGSMEIAVRNYGDYGVVILGSVSGIIIVYTLSAYFGANLPLIARILDVIGKNTIYILIVHTLLGVYINSVVKIRFDPNYMAFLICSVILQITVGTAIGESISFIKRFFLKKGSVVAQ
ncbi:MAG: acyltransferase family protein [Lachnospiraceae bacterium]|nr:acyltransferase family protein [Lachnospiraceae bacterium]